MIFLRDGRVSNAVELGGGEVEDIQDRRRHPL
jgi:hypothetical protein